MKPKPFEIIVEFIPQSTKTGITYEAHKKGSLIRCKDCKHRDPEDKKCDCGHSIRWQLPRSDEWFCADAERRGEGWKK